jgi:superoxide dismutase, Cu-Zn family
MRLFFASFLTIFLLSSCVQEEINEVIYEGPVTDFAVAVIHPTDGNEAAGVVTFTREDEGIRVNATISGLQPGQPHGFHVHQYGDCRSGDGLSAGGHYNPHDMPHAGPTDTERHMGDLGNLPANDDGVANLEYLDEKLVLNGKDSIIGYAVIVHRDQDDLVSQPVGNAGPRIGCGIIGVGNPDF